MAKLYISNLEISRSQGLNEALSLLVEKKIAEAEKQESLMKLYDIEIQGIAIYYRKQWRYDRAISKE